MPAQIPAWTVTKMRKQRPHTCLILRCVVLIQRLAALFVDHVHRCYADAAQHIPVPPDTVMDRKPVATVNHGRQRQYNTQQTYRQRLHGIS